MTQQYTPVAWQDETTSQQGTLINAERLNQMQTAHHYADGFEEVDAVPTADPGVAYHKVVYCTADNTFYRWDGTEWTKDIDDETKALLNQEIARATEAESTLRGQLEDEHDARVDAEAAINDRITDEATELGQRIATEASTRYTADTALGTRITAEETRATQAEQANAQAIANTYTKAETDTLLASKADSTALATKLDTLSTTGLHAYTHNGTTQSEVAVIDGTTASTIPIRDANGRLQAADPASGATDKSLVTANWVSQTGDSSPNNLLHKSGNEYFTGTKTAGSTCGFRTPFKRDEVPASSLISPSIIFRDADNHDCFVISASKEGNGSMRGYFTLYNNVEGVVKNAALRFSITAQNQTILQIIDTNGNYHTIASY